MRDTDDTVEELSSDCPKIVIPDLIGDPNPLKRF